MWVSSCKTALSEEFFRQEYWSGSPFPSPGDLPDPGIESRPPAFGAQSLSHWTTREVSALYSFNLCYLVHTNLELLYLPIELDF